MKVGLSWYIPTARTKAAARGPPRTGNKGFAAPPVGSPALGPAANRCWRGAFQAPPHPAPDDDTLWEEGLWLPSPAPDKGTCLISAQLIYKQGQERPPKPRPARW